MLNRLGFILQRGRDSNQTSKRMIIRHLYSFFKIYYTNYEQPILGNFETLNYLKNYFNQNLNYTIDRNTESIE